MRASRGAENGPKSHPASTGTKFRERAKRGLNRSKNAISGRKICKNEWGGEIRVTLILRHVNDSFPTARKMRKIRLFASLTGGDGGCARDAGKGRGPQRLGRRRFHDPEGGSGFFAGASGGAPMKKAPPGGGALCERMLPSRRTGGRSVIWPASSRCRPAGRRCGRRSRCRPGRCRRDGCRRARRP